MISNQATSSANMTGDLFQIFNLPKSGNSSYLFSDIIKVIGSESEGENVNSLTSSFFADGSKSLIDSNKLISLLKLNMSAGKTTENTGEDLTGKFYITETELTDFINKLGLEGPAEAAKLSSEIAVEVTPAFLNKLSALINNNKFQVHKNIFATIAPDEEQPKEIELSDGEESDEAEGSEKIQVIFKKVEPENDVIAVPQQFVFNTEQNTSFGTGEADADGEFFFGGQSKNIVLGGNKYEFFADTSSGNTQGAQVLSGGATASANTEQAASGKGAADNTFAEVFAEMNAPAGTAETAEVPEAVKTFKSDGSFFTQSPEAEIEAPVVKTPEVKTPEVNTKTGNPVVNTQANNFTGNTKLQESPENSVEDITAPSEYNPGDNDKNLSAGNLAKEEINIQNPEISKPLSGQIKTDSPSAVQNKVTVENSGDEVSANDIVEDNTPVLPVDEQAASTEADVEPGIQGVKTEQKDNTKTYGQPVKHSSPDLQKNNELRGTEKNSAAQSSSEHSAKSEPGKEYESTFHFSNRFTNEILKNRNGLNHNGYNQVKADNSNIYEISFEKTKAEGEHYSEKILPQDFDTSDYETLSSGIFSNKAGDSFKEYKSVENTEVNNEKINLKPNQESESNAGSGEQAANSGNKSSNENSSKSAYKPSNEVTFADHMQHKTAGMTENAAPKTVKGYTSVFKEIDAAHLVDEIKTFCLKGEKSNITLKLSPEHLGAVKLSIDIKDSVMNTSIEVENESVRQVVQNNIDTLRQSLQQNGIQLSSFSVSLSNQHDQKSSGKSGNKKEKQQENDGIKLKTEEKTVKTKKLGYNTYEYLA